MLEYTLNPETTPIEPVNMECLGVPCLFRSHPVPRPDRVRSHPVAPGDGRMHRHSSAVDSEDGRSAEVKPR